MIKVAILYICTGKYSRFFADFYTSAKKYLLNDVAHVEYFVFTDDQNIVETEDVHIIHKESRGFPYDTLFRFDMFLSIEKELEAFDYAFFFNSNMVFVDHIGLDLIPKEEGLAAVIHPGYYNKPALIK